MIFIIIIIIIIIIFIINTSIGKSFPFGDHSGHKLLVAKCPERPQTSAIFDQLLLKRESKRRYMGLN